MTIEELYYAMWRGGLNDEQGDLLDELVTRCHRLERERDAAVTDLKRIANCVVCSHFNPPLPYLICLRCEQGSEWEWRGLSLENETSDKKEEEE